jgi:glycosyltransferase involved in cell wall biosynthesis
MRVVLFHNVVAPYRHALFEALAGRVSLEVWYSTLRTFDRSWSTAVPAGYRSRVLPRAEWRFFRRPVIVCPGLARSLDRHRPDAVLSVLTRSNWIDTLRICSWGRRRGVPVVLWVGQVESDAFDDGLPRVVGRVSEWYYRRALAAASGLLCYSGRSLEWARIRGASGPARTGTQVLEDPGAAPRTGVSAAGRTTALFVGKLEERKGVDLLLRSVAALPAPTRETLSLRLVGDGPLAAEARSFAGRFPCVECAGPLPRERLLEEYRAADLLVLPSRHDPWGFVTNEAMAMGTPVLASRQAGSAELAERAGWVWDARDERSLAPALATALDECRDASRRSAAVDAERGYRPGPCADRIADLLREVARA